MHLDFDMKTEPPGPTCSAHTPQNVDSERKAIQRSPGRSNRGHSMKLELSKSTVKLILRDNLGFHTCTGVKWCRLPTTPYVC